VGRATGISWTRSTRNFWSGCTKVGPGCDGCYAEAFNRFTKGKNAATGQAINWGPGAPRIQHLEGAAKDLRKWNEICAIERERGVVSEKDKSGWSRPGFWPVFLNSHSDFFDNEVDQSWRDYACRVIEDCPNLTFLLVTKRIGNARGMLPSAWMLQHLQPNVWLGATIVNQVEADRDLGKLIGTPAAVHFVSYEPAIGAVDWAPWLKRSETSIDYAQRVGHDAPPGSSDRIDWLIAGGESDQSGHETRVFNIAWARSAIAQCRAHGAAPFVKQLGSNPYGAERPRDRAGADPTEWPEDLRVQEFPV
jgi:protein gp37